jgi:alkylation response protein AidB-like acyl-CoA dehydrogenase
MDFGLDEAQQLLAASARKLIEEEFPIGYVRSMLEEGRDFPADFWARAAELGWLGLLIEPPLAGAGLGPLELVALAQELGRGLIPGPFLGSAVLATTALDAAGTPELRERWLPRLARGESLACLAIPEMREAWGPDRIPFEAVPSRGSGFRISGVQRFVPDANLADLILVPARLRGEPAGDVWIFAVERRLAGVEVATLSTIDPTRRMCELRIDDVEVGSGTALLATSGWGALERAIDVGRVALCGEMVGGAERALEACVEYARTRVQFGKPIGSFQAIQHKCADMLLRVEAGRAATFAAATALAHGDPDASRDASIAKAYCSEAYRHVTTEGVQIHGGLGFTWDLDMHLYYKRAKASEMLLGDARWNRERIAEHALGAAR